MEPASIKVRALEDADRAWARGVLESRWHSARIVTRGRVHQADRLPGFLAEVGDERAGLLTYREEPGAWEIVSLDSLRERCGVGSALLAAVQRSAQQAGCRRVWLVTTNDSLPALRFYQRRGFVLVAIHRDALEAARILKPEIPRLGLEGIPLRDEIELEIALRQKMDHGRAKLC